MLPELLAVAITLLVGPITFWLLNKLKFRGKYPVGIIDGIGDWVLLPAFNALAVHYGALGFIFSDPARILIAFTCAFIPTRVFMIWRKDFAKHDDWTRPKLRHFNPAGWYHLTFLFCQTFFVVATMLYLYSQLWLWVPILLFGAVMVARIVELQKK